MKITIQKSMFRSEMSDKQPAKTYVFITDNGNIYIQRYKLMNEQSNRDGKLVATKFGKYLYLEYMAFTARSFATIASIFGEAFKEK